MLNDFLGLLCGDFKNFSWQTNINIPLRVGKQPGKVCFLTVNFNLTMRREKKQNTIPKIPPKAVLCKMVPSFLNKDSRSKNYLKKHTYKKTTKPQADTMWKEPKNPTVPSQWPPLAPRNPQPPTRVGWFLGST